MSEIKQASTFVFDRNGAKFFRAKLDAHLKALADEMGITIRSGRGSFNPDTKEITMKVEASAGEESAAAKFAALAPSFGLDTTDFGKTIKGDAISGITPTGRMMILRTGETQPRLYPVKALPSLVALLHPGEPKRMATARIATGHPLPNDYSVAYPNSGSGLVEVENPFELFKRDGAK